MKLLKQTPFEVGWFTWHWRPGRPARTVVVKATFELGFDAPCTLADPQEPLRGEAYHDDDPEQSLRIDTDLAPFKPHGECFVLGSFHAPSGVPVQRSQVAFQIGSVTKSIAVVGDRTWGTFGPSEPQPFTTMPLRWERAFGGPSHADNPLGRGIGTSRVDGRDVPSLPNLEDPLALLEGKGDRPRPVCSAPVPRTFASRLALAGTYDERWRKERYPHFPEDLSFRYFDAAPTDQQIAGYWRGNEEIALLNLVRDAPRVRTGLPGFWPRCLLVPQSNAAYALELELRLDTITVDAEARKVLCVWRAPQELAADPREQSSHLFVTHDVPGAWRSVDRLRADAAAELAAVAARAEEGAAEAPALDGGGADEPLPLFKTVIGTELKWAGVDQALTMAVDSTPVEVLQEMAGLLRQHGANLDEVGGWLSKSLPSIFDVPPPRPLDERELRAIEERVLAEESARRTTADGAALRRRVQEAVMRGESCAEWDLSGVDLSRLRLSGGDFRRAVFKKANLAGTIFGDTIFDEAIFEEAELSDASFHAASFVGAQLHFCRLERTHFGDSVLDHASITDSFLRDARFSRSFVRRAELHGSHLERTTFDDSDLGGADFSGARLDDALFARTSMVDAWLIDGVSAQRIRLDRCDVGLLRAFGGADLTESRFAACHGAGARFHGANLEGSDLSFSDLARSDFSGAALRRAKLMGCRLRHARFDGAMLEGASLIRSDLFQARLEGTDLTNADLRGANLFQAELLDATLAGTRLELANLDGTRLAR